ncbi:hypothetical protein GGI07_004312 [Coemansia sp. Benny D115]|nr:hypothetical protein GGI07_004312 [Coemansia sp. Benny D115]
MSSTKDTASKESQGTKFPIKLRNYNSIVAGGGLTAEIEQQTVDASVSGVMETALSKHQNDLENTELDIAAIAPRRANWDLKRDLQKRLDHLKPQNDAAIADLIRLRIQESGDAEDLAAAVLAHAAEVEEKQ